MADGYVIELKWKKRIVKRRPVIECFFTRQVRNWIDQNDWFIDFSLSVSIQWFIQSSILRNSVKIISYW